LTPTGVLSCPSLESKRSSFVKGESGSLGGSQYLWHYIGTRDLAGFEELTANLINEEFARNLASRCRVFMMRIIVTSGDAANESTA